MKVEVVGALLGETLREIVPHTYSHMGISLSKDFIRIERNNQILEDVFGGQYYYRALLLFANCQHFDLTANRNDIRTDQEEYDLAVEGIKKFCKEIKNDDFLIRYFKSKQDEDNEKKDRDDDKKVKERLAKGVYQRKDRINSYKGRSNMSFHGLISAPVKEPTSEAETALLLQSMISSRHQGIDFIIGDYNTARGVDLIVEMIDKEMPSMKWAELVSSLDKLYAWNHPPEAYHIIICIHWGT